MERTRYAASILLWISMLLTAAATHAESIAVVVSETLEEPVSISIGELRDVYLGNSRSSAGVELTPVDQDVSTPIYSSFAGAVIGRSRRALENYWLEEILSGGRMPPRQMEGNEAVARLVASRAKTIGYVSWKWLEGRAEPGLRVLRIRHQGRELAPGDSRYPLQSD
ncbi:MAG: hypothetical protein GY946_32195 [bacterium]|nr:hypothetical protein [bacterium]